MSDDIKHEGRTVTKEIRIAASPEEVWRAWAEPEGISRWFTDDARGGTEEGATITWIFEGFGFEAPYKVLKAEPGERYALLFESPDRSGILEITLRQEGGETVVHLVNSGFRGGAEWDEEYEGIDSGWTLALAQLKLHLEENAGKEKKTVEFYRPVGAAVEEMEELFHGTEGPGSWILEEGRIGEVGSGAKLRIRGGRALEGRVLADTGREVALSWPEVNGSLELKQFSMGPSRLAGVRVNLWEPFPVDPETLARELEPLVDRLAARFPAPAEAPGQAPPAD